MPKYSMPFIAKIHRFLKVCMDINNLETSTVLEVKNLIRSEILNSEIIKEINTSYQNEFDKLKFNSITLLKYFYKKSIKENFYFFDCPFEVYMNHYESRKEKFLKKTIDSSELDFVESELQNLKNPSENKIITIKYSCINKFLTSINKQTIDFQKLKINKSGNNVISFHNKSATINYSKLIKSGYKWKYSFNKKIKYLNYRLNEIEREEEQNKKMEKQLSTNQIVILFDKVGVFSLPAFETTYKTRISTLLSCVLNKNSSKINASIRKLENKKTTQNYQDDIDLVDQLLMNLKK
jgi:hypothetical protein